MKIIEGENYPTSEQLQRVRDAARELEEAMRACPEVSFEVHYGQAYRKLPIGETLHKLIPDAVTVYCSRHIKVSA